MIFMKFSSERGHEMKKRFKKHPNIYLALFVCLVAVGIGTVTGFLAGGPDEEQAVLELVKLVESGFAE